MHSNVIPCLHAELCSGGTVVQRLAGHAMYCERDAARIMLQLLHALQHLHQRGIVHMDIKPENIMFASRYTGPLHVLPQHDG